MSFKPNPYILTQEMKKYLNDFEIIRVKDLQGKLNRAPFERDKKALEIEILYIYRDAINRYNEEHPQTLWDWLNDEEKSEVNKITEKIKKSQNFRESRLYEASVYQIYLNSICRHTDFQFKNLVEKYLKMLKVCETKRESEILVSIIIDLFPGTD